MKTEVKVAKFKVICIDEDKKIEDMELTVDTSEIAPLIDKKEIVPLMRFVIYDKKTNEYHGFITLNRNPWKSIAVFDCSNANLPDEKKRAVSLIQYLYETFVMQQPNHCDTIIVENLTNETIIQDMKNRGFSNKDKTSNTLFMRGKVDETFNIIILGVLFLILITVATL